MAAPNVGLRTESSYFVNWNTQPNIMTFYVRWSLSFPVVNGGAHDGEFEGIAAINSDMSQGFTNVQNDIINQMIPFLNARYGVTFGGGQVVWLP